MPSSRKQPTVEAPLVEASKTTTWLTLAGLGLVLLLGLLAYFQPWVPGLLPVNVETITLAPATRILAVNGRIEPVQSVDVRPQVTGRLTDLLVAEGDVVQAKAILGHIAPAAQQAVVRQAQAGLEAALVARGEAMATHNRTKALGPNASRLALDNAARDEQSAIQEVIRMAALRDQALVQLGFFTLRAPMAGTVLLLPAETGQIVDPATVLLTIADLSQLIVATDVDEAYATQIHVGQRAALQLAGETTVRDGHVHYVSQKVEASTGGLEVKLTPDVELMAPVGLTVTTNITVDTRAAAITVPRAALQKGIDGDAVFVLLEGVAHRRAVVVIEWPAARLIVTQGLREGDVVIVDAAGLADGQAVRRLP